MDRAIILAALSEVAPGRDFGNVADDANLIDLGFIDSGMFLDLISILEERSGREIDFLDIDAAFLTSINGLLSAFDTKATHEIGKKQVLKEGPSVLIAEDFDEAVATIVIAFCSDPVMGWLLPNPKKRLAFLRDFASFFIKNSQFNCSVHVLPDFSGTAIWTSVGEISPTSKLQSIFAEHVSLNVLRHYFSMSGELDSVRPAGKHLTLQLIGVDPVRQGQGIATALLEHGLKEADREGLSAYLESTNPRNESLYRRFGFEVVKEVSIAGSPTRKAMIRTCRFGGL
jgi:predicted GNAT family acetyltransferase/acyl carrier protein